MQILRLASSSLPTVIGMMAFLALSSLAAPGVQAQSPPSGGVSRGPIGFGGNSPSPELLYAAARPPEFSYTNSLYGLSFRFPSNFVLHLGDYDRGIYSSHGDRGEILLVSDEIPSEFWMGTNAAVMMLYVGVNPNLSAESCAALVGPDEWTSGGTLRLTVGGVELKGRNEIQKGSGRGMQFGLENIYRRQYVGYTNGICYEFEIDMTTLDQTRIRVLGRLVQVDLERIFVEMEAVVLTAKFVRPNSSALGAEARKGRVTRPWETSLRFPKELAALEKLADWHIQYPAGISRTSFQYKICGTGNSENYMPITFEYGSSLDDTAANAAIDKLSDDVVRLIQQNGWKLNPLPTGGVSRLDCYVKDSVFVDFTKGTSRCTMNSPCTAHDQLTVTIYVPTAAAGVVQ